VKHFLLNILPCAGLLALLVFVTRKHKKTVELLTSQCHQAIRERNEARADYQTAVQACIVWSNTVNVLNFVIRERDAKKEL
jgi:hypothetical protein